VNCKSYSKEPGEFFPNGKHLCKECARHYNSWLWTIKARFGLVKGNNPFEMKEVKNELLRSNR